MQGQEGGENVENYRFSRSGSTTLCFYNVKHDLGFIGVGDHDDPEEAKRLAYEDAANKAKVICINKLAMYHSWKNNHR